MRIRDFRILFSGETISVLGDLHATLMFVVAGVIIVAAVGIGLLNGVAPRMREMGTA